MGDQFTEYLVDGHEVEDADVARVGVEKLEMGILALGFDRGLGFPQAAKGAVCFLLGEHTWESDPSVLLEVGLSFSLAVRHVRRDVSPRMPQSRGRGRKRIAIVINLESPGLAIADMDKI